MVCTTIRPTRIPYPELLEWRGCAALVSDYLIYEPLAKPILAVSYIFIVYTLYTFVDVQFLNLVIGIFREDISYRMR